MKIRTDFVTNSSSSSFSVEVSIIDKSGKSYSVGVSPYEYDCDNGGTASFSGELGKAMTKFAFKKLEELEDKYELKEVDKEGRNDRIESVKVGDTVRLVKVQEEADEDEYGYGYGAQDNCYIDVQNAEGSLGILPSDPTWILLDFLDDDKVELVATVADVTPLSQRRKNAKKALISIHIEAKIVGEDSSIHRFSDIADLCKFLTDSIEDGCCDDEYDDYDDEDEEEFDEDDFDFGSMSTSAFRKELEAKKATFTENVIKKVKTIDNISKIVVSRYYGAWGQFAELIADNDETLCELAQKVNNASGVEKEAAKAEMLKYIHTPNGDRGRGRWMEFGSDFEDFRYLWSDDDAELDALVERLCSNSGPGSVEGTEYCEINMETGEYIKYAEFVLN